MSGDRGARIGLWIKGAYRSGLEKRCAMWETDTDEFDDIVAMAHRELASARHKADNVIANAQSQASSLVEEAEFEGRQIVQRAMAQADGLRERSIRRVAAELETLRSEARAEGLEAGRLEGIEELRRRHDEALTLLQTLEAERARYLAEQADSMMDFALSLAGRALGMARQAWPELLEGNLRQLLADPALVGESLQLTVHPDDGEAMRRLCQEHEAAELKLAFDPAVKRGSCRIRGELLNVDLDFDERFRRLEAEVLRSAGRLDR